MQLASTNKAPSEVVSHYLEAIYYIWAEKEPIRSSRLADWLSVSRPTVTVALQRMSRDGLVRMNGRKEVELTARGMRMAEAIVRRHRIMERWLTDGLGLDWVTADEEAARLEHAVSDVAEREAPPLLAYLHQRDLTPGRQVKVLEVDDVAKTLRVSVADREVTLSHETAAKLWAVPSR
jgi:Mn-dependent DtxR family transcriptional regulator